MEIIKTHIINQGDFLINYYQKSKEEILQLFLDDMKRELKLDNLIEILKIIFEYMKSRNKEKLEELKDIFDCNRYEISEMGCEPHTCIELYHGDEFIYNIEITHSFYFKPSKIRLRYDPQHNPVFYETIKYIDIPIIDWKIFGISKITYELFGRSCDQIEVFQNYYEDGILQESDGIFPEFLTE